MYQSILLCRSQSSKVARLKGRLTGATYRSTARCSFSHTTNSQQDYKVGDVIHGYKLEQVDHIRELNLRPFLFRHELTGAHHLHLAKEDDNNVFSVMLRTIPKNSTGVAHILEHLALCGSAKFPVRDPFFKMTTRSLATFMNAFTGPDFTAYPFSTQNKKDFENLLSIYLDAVFFPRLRQVDFRQEGWRLEHEQPDKKETPIIIRGVVYNEMKGAFSSTEAIYSRQLLNNIFADNIYKHESGGDPISIPDLTHEELKKFHQLHYHPSNAKFFTYGDIPVAEHLKLINDSILSKFSENLQAREQSIVTLQEMWQKPRTVNITCPPDPVAAKPDCQTTTSISYLLPLEVTNLHDMFAVSILSTLLISGQSSPFHKSLFESEYGSDYSPSYGLHQYPRQPIFSVGLKGLHENEVPKVHKIIEDTFIKTAKEGFPQWRVDAILHDIELSLKHIKGNMGLRMFMNLEPVWLHEGDPIDCFQVNKYVKRFKQDLAQDKNYWRNLIERCFLSNNHQLKLNMSPDEKFEEKRNQRERDVLQGKLVKLGDVEKQALFYEGMELMKIQNTKDDPSILPSLQPSKDISKELAYRVSPKIESHQGIATYFFEQPTNEVVYFRGLTDFTGRLKAANLDDYLPVFCNVATSLGAGSYNRHKLDEKISLTTGGLNTSFMNSPSLSEYDKFNSKLLFSSYCLRRNIGSMFDLWANIFERIQFDESIKYLADRVKSRASALAESVPDSGSSYAIKQAAKNLGGINEYDERLCGLTQVARMKDMASKESIESVASKLKAIARIVFDPRGFKCAIHAEADAMKQVQDEYSKFIETIQRHGQDSNPISSMSDQTYEQTKVEDLKFPFATHYVAKCMAGTSFLHKDYAKIAITAMLISSKYLLREVREKGGAYGASCRLIETGVIGMYSNRDPNSDKTMDIFDHAKDWAEDESNYNDQDIEESKLGVFQQVDKPTAPGERGLGLFVHGLTDDMRQELRERLLQVSRRDIAYVAQKYLAQKKVGRYIL